jgi:hypothetical protein
MESKCQLTRKKLIVVLISYCTVEIKILWVLKQLSVGLLRSAILLWISREVRQAQPFMHTVFKHEIIQCKYYCNDNKISA